MAIKRKNSQRNTTEKSLANSESIKKRKIDKEAELNNNIINNKSIFNETFDLSNIKTIEKSCSNALSKNDGNDVNINSLNINNDIINSDLNNVDDSDKFTNDKMKLNQDIQSEQISLKDNIFSESDNEIDKDEEVNKEEKVKKDKEVNEVEKPNEFEEINKDEKVIENEETIRNIIDEVLTETNGIRNLENNINQGEENNKDNMLNIINSDSINEDENETISNNNINNTNDNNGNYRYNLV
ncbi:hypothetical protein H8356DRAFT_959184 [Neocallimastix lanati (nom. inval.)]|nr:hypothetical protein H8356DRAFT_959184 [Neocallimastix sp. JGI-2020a]